MASETPTVLYCQASMPLLLTASLAVLARLRTIFNHGQSKPNTSCQSKMSKGIGNKGGRHTMHAVIVLVFWCVMFIIGNEDLLARVAFPPYGGNANLRSILHCLPIWYTGSIKHGLRVDGELGSLEIPPLRYVPEPRESHVRP